MENLPITGDANLVKGQTTHRRTTWPKLGVNDGAQTGLRMRLALPGQLATALAGVSGYAQASRRSDRVDRGQSLPKNTSTGYRWDPSRTASRRSAAGQLEIK
jgi:hypothetical protein